MQKVVILAGGMGTRLAEQTDVRPKPMVEIGGYPILWHIMKSYAHHGFKEFVIALGYKGEIIKRFFRDYAALNGSMTLNLATGVLDVHGRDAEDWTVHLMDTGVDVLTGGRLKRLTPLLQDAPFLLTYGDGVSDVDPRDVLATHRKEKKIATVTAVRPPARFGGLVVDGQSVVRFTEKSQIDEGWINGGFMCMEPSILSYVKDDRTVLETDILERLAAENQLAAHQHTRFWHCMDTMRDLRTLEELWLSGAPPWKLW